MPEPRAVDARDGGSPEGPPRLAWFDGILEGRPGDATRLREVVARINEQGFARMDLDLDGGKFSLLMDDRPIPPAAMTRANLGSLLAGLQELAALSPEAGRLESTVRCTEVYADGVRETLFAIADGSVRCVSRWRPPTEDDLRRSRGPALTTGATRLGWGKALLIGGLLLAAFLLVAWNGGYVDRLLAPRSAALAVAATEFEGLLGVELATWWGSYRVTIRRGPRYPASIEEIDRLHAAATTPLQRAAIDALANGNAVHVRLEDERGRVLEVARCDLRPLLGSATGSVKVRLPGRMTAKLVRIALDSGRAGG